MGVPGAGKSRVAEEYAARGYVRLNRDERGGTLRDIAAALDEQLSSGVRRLVLDNTYLTRASRSYAIEVAARHGVAARCIWLDTPLAQAQVNLVERLLERFGSLPAPEELQSARKARAGRARADLADAGAPRARAAGRRRGLRQRRARPVRTRAGGRAVRSLRRGFGSGRVRLGEGHRSRRTTPDLRLEPGRSQPMRSRRRHRSRGRPRSPWSALPHRGGPPICWCRPPLPGLPLAFARAHGVDPARSTLIGTSPAHKTLATTLGARYVAV